MIRALKLLLPWLITGAALYWVFRDADFARMKENIQNGDIFFLSLAFFLTTLSYLLRARRWQSLFPRRVLGYVDSTRVLILGFFMNNILPARTGELVRAHLGSQVTKESRALVLGTIASERLVDGLTLSVLFVLFSTQLGDYQYANELLLIAGAFAVISIGVVTFLAAKTQVIQLLKRLAPSLGSGFFQYIGQKTESFVEGLTPLYSWKNLTVISFWSIVIWFIELSVYVSISYAYGADLSLAESVLFLVAVNFSSLIPAAPGGIGVIEAAATAILTSVHVEHERALTMVLTQHAIQYLVIGITGICALISWKGGVRSLATKDPLPKTTSEQAAR